MDKSEISILLDFVLKSIELIEKRFEKINDIDDFLTEDGLLILDAISMRLQAIGEALKNIEKKDKEFLLQIAPKDYWSKIIKTREIISHHYINLDAEIVYMICDEKLDELKKYISKLKEMI
ncbi:HepT-like ribonuclease domain-containing protein [Nautilia sp.]